MRYFIALILLLPTLAYAQPSGRVQCDINDASKGTQTNDLDVVGTVTCNAGTNLNTSALATSALQLPNDHDVNVSNASIPVTQSGAWTNACTQSGTWNINNVSGTVSLPTGAATSAKQLLAGHDVTVDNTVGAAGVYIQGQQVEGAARAGNPVGICINDVANDGDCIVPDGIAAGAFTVLGVVPVDAGGEAVDVTGNGLHSNLRNAAGAEVGTALSPLTVTGSMTETNSADILTDTGNMDTSLNNIEADADDIRIAVEGELTVKGTTADGAALSDDPVVTGYLGTDYEPNTEDEQGPGEVTDGDAVYSSANLRGERIEGVNKMYVLLTGLDLEYDDDPTTATSAAVEVWNYRWCRFSWCVDNDAGAPTTIQVQAKISYDTVYYDLIDGPLASLIWEDQGTDPEICQSVKFQPVARFIKFTVTAGTSSGNTFIVDDSMISCEN